MTPCGGLGPTVLFLVCLALWCCYRAWNLLVGSDFIRPVEILPGLLATAGAVVLTGLTAAIAFGALPRRWAPAALALQTVLAFWPYVLTGEAWWAASALVVTSLLLVLDGGWGRLLAGLVVAAEFLVQAVWRNPHRPVFAVYCAMVTLTVGLAFFAMARLTRYAAELRATRAELAPLEVARERLRIARGLDAALGERLALVLALARAARSGQDAGTPTGQDAGTPTGQDAGARPRAGTDAAADRTARIVEVARTALAEVRTVAADQRERSLDDEVEAARSVLEAAGVAVAVEASPLRLPAAEDAALAALLHQTVVAVLRAEPPARCSIALDAPGVLTVSFPGSTIDLRDALQGPAERIAEVGGRIETTPSSVRASVPARPRRDGRESGTAPWLAWFVLLAFEIDHIGTTLVALYDGGSDLVGITWARYPAAFAVLPLVAVLQLRHVFPREDGAPPPALRTSLLLQIGLLAAAFLVIGPKMPTSYGALAAGVVLFHGRPPWSWGTAAVLVGLPVLRGYQVGAGWAWALSNLSNAVMVVIMVYVLCRLPVAIAALAEARRKVARMAVVEERLRIARDVHDLMGFQLSALVVKGELAGRLADRDPDAARTQLDELVTLAEEALASVRSIARVRASLSLPAEIGTARSMLTAAGIEVRVDADDPPPGVEASAAAVVLREAVTNIV
ncbi:histidine kinase, partial [Spirillospora sp. NPDC049652]